MKPAAFLVIAVSVVNQAGGSTPGAVAKVMHCRGPVVLVRDGQNLGKIKLLQELIANDQLLLEAKAELILDYRADLREQIGAKQKLTEKITLTVRATGCEPAKAMERIKIKSYAGQFKNLQALPMGSRAGRAAGMVFRSKDLPADPPVVQPMWGAKLLQPRPDFSWQIHPKAAGYLVQLQNHDGERLWSAETTKPRLTFPKGEKELGLGNVYRWQVSAILPGKKDQVLWESIVLMANAKEQKACADWLDVIAQGNQADRLQAAAVFQKVGAYQESQKVYELLHKDAPDEPFFAAALADHYQRGGRVDEAEKLAALAKKLGYRPFQANEPESKK